MMALDKRYKIAGFNLLLAAILFSRLALNLTHQILWLSVLVWTIATASAASGFLLLLKRA